MSNVIDHIKCPRCEKETSVDNSKNVSTLNVVNKKDFKLVECTHCGGNILVELKHELL